jgi:hypothetical protein
MIDLSLHLRPSASSADRFSSSLGNFCGSFSGLIEGSISDSFRGSGGLASFGLPHPSILAIFGGHQSAVTPLWARCIDAMDELQQGVSCLPNESLSRHSLNVVSRSKRPGFVQALQDSPCFRLVHTVVEEFPLRVASCS